MSSQSSPASGGLSSAFVLGVVFIVLKLAGVVSWSWVWVLAPFWIPVTLLVLLVVLPVAVARMVAK